MVAIIGFAPYVLPALTTFDPDDSGYEGLRIGASCFLLKVTLPPATAQARPSQTTRGRMRPAWWPG